jgi:hypothetical protein
MQLTLTIESNQNLSAILKTWIVDPEGKYTDAGESNIVLSSTEPLLFTDTYSLSTSVSGIHRLVYGIYIGDLLLVSGSEAFDVGNAVLLGISTHKTDYSTNTEPVNVKVSMFGTVDASLELVLDGTTVETQSVSLNGFATLDIEIGIVEPGTHILKAILAAGGLKSTKETTFTYALSLLDSDNDGMPDEWEVAHGLDPNNPADANLDQDNDGLTNLQEYQNGTNPTSQDTDNDGMPDGWEITYGLNPNVDDASSDKDNDGYNNLQEYQSGSNPNDPSSIPNQPPVANAGPDQNVITNTLVTLNGSESYDPEGTMITFYWTFTEVPVGSNITDAALSDITSAKPAFTPDVDGTYRLELTVNDGILDSTPDEVVIIASTPNVAPNANAGPDQNVFTGETVLLDGSSSSDPDNKPLPLSYLWNFDFIPSGSLLTNDNIAGRDQANASFIPDVDGSYIISLTVSDSELSSAGTVHIMATTPNVPPNADAGVDITIYLGQTAILDGSASNDPDNGPQPLSYRWSFVAVPAGSLLSNDDISGADTVSPSFTPDISGTYVIELMVSDGLDFEFDNVAVTVPECDAFSSIVSNFNGTTIAGNNYIWFNSIVKVSGLGSNPAIILFNESEIQFTANGTNYELSVPNTEIVFSPTATLATTNFVGGKWVTTVPSNYTGNVFLSGLAYKVPDGGLPGGINPVTWSGYFSTDTSDVTVQWKWAAAVYTQFSTDYTLLGVKPIDGDKLNEYTNSDHAGTPEYFKSHVIGGARGGGGSNYTGSYSGTKSKTPCLF